MPEDEIEDDDAVLVIADADGADVIHEDGSMHPLDDTPPGPVSRARMRRDTLKGLRTDLRHLEGQIEMLGDFIMREYPSEIGRGQESGFGASAVEIAIRLLDIPAVHAVIDAIRNASLPESGVELLCSRCDAVYPVGDQVPCPESPGRGPHEAMRTKTGRVLTNTAIERLADEAEQGYDVEHLKRRPRG